MIFQNQEKEFFIGKTKIGGKNPCFIVAEIGINFNGKYENAINLINIAAKAGCNAVKFQLFRAKKMYVEKAGDYFKTNGVRENIFKLVRKAELPGNWIPKLKKYANDNGLEFFSTACDEESADVLEKNNVSAYKIASYEITHIPLLRHIAKKKKPIIFSSAGATIKEIKSALKVLKEEGNKEIVLMHCIGRYPAPLDELNLNVINDLRKRFPGAIIGYSDHSLDPITAPGAAVGLGARVIEKHITLDKNMPGPDHFFALEPEQLSLMVRAIRRTEREMRIGKKIEVDPSVLGSSQKKTLEGEEYIRNFAYRCVFATKEIKKGELFSSDNIAVLRPGNAKRGIEPKYYEVLINGCRAIKNIKKGMAIKKRDYGKKFV